MERLRPLNLKFSTYMSVPLPKIGFYLKTVYNNFITTATALYEYHVLYRASIKSSRNPFLLLDIHIINLTFIEYYATLYL